jgi:Membrane proteins related to metalloendopeptidases
MIPVPDAPGVDTPYGRRGPYWSCDEDAHGNGIHTGVDYAAPAGTKVVAARPGTLVHSSHGSSFGTHQVDIICQDGTRDFYAHMRSRTGEGWIDAGDKVGEVGSEGNATGPHLHFERHATTTGGWSCSVVRGPAAVHRLGG